MLAKWSNLKHEWGLHQQLEALWLTKQRTQCAIGIQDLGGHGLLSIGKVANKKMDKNTKEKIFFKDVAGCDEEKQGIMEFVHFLI